MDRKSLDELALKVPEPEWSAAQLAQMNAAGAQRGRPAGTDQRELTRSVTCNDEMWDELQAIGRGNRSQGLRSLVWLHRELVAAGWIDPGAVRSLLTAQIPKAVRDE